MNDGLQQKKSITLTPTLVEIGRCAFHDCRNLREVGLNGIPHCRYSVSVDYLDWFQRDTFHNCDALERFLFPTVSFRLENIIQTGHWEEVEDKLNEARGVVQWESDKLLVSREILEDWGDARDDLGRITRLVSYYELKGGNKHL